MLVYWLPPLAIVASGFLGVGGLTVTVIWTMSFTIMGVVCVINALRCGRMHCYFMGPFLLLLGVGSLLHGLGAVFLGPNGWQWLGGIAVAGAAFLMVVPERMWGRYARRR